MQNTSFPDCASLVQACQAIDITSTRPNLLSDGDLKSLWTGQGARECEELAQRYGNARAMRLYALSGRPIDGSELAEIYHGQFARAATATQSGPDFARQEWQEALANAQREADAAHYVHGRELKRTVSRDGMDNASGDDCASLREWTARTCRRGSLRRLVRHARECLVVHYSLSGGRKWRASLSLDLAMLATLARVARGAGFGEFGQYSTFNSSAARRALERLAARMAVGDLLMTEQPAAAERVLADYLSEKA